MFESLTTSHLGMCFVGVWELKILIRNNEKINVSLCQNSKKIQYVKKHIKNDRGRSDKRTVQQ